MKKIRIFDIDGTITHPGIDLWYLVTKSLSIDAGSFEKIVLAWKKDIDAGRNPYSSSLSVMRKGLDLMPRGITGKDVRSEAKKISKGIINKGSFFKGAIEHINNSIRKDFRVVFSTTDYYEAGLGFLDGLIECDMTGKESADGILISGSRIDWENKKIIHFNMGDGKIKDICNQLNTGLQGLITMIDSCYIDDPAGNDSAFLNLPSKAFIIRNDKNKNRLLLKNMVLTDWDEILS